MMNGAGPHPEREQSLARFAWSTWLAYTHRAAEYQAQAVLSIAYYLVLGPSVLVARLAGTRLLDLDTRPRASYWRERRPLERTLEALERQF